MLGLSHESVVSVILGAFAKFRKASISFVIAACLSVSLSVGIEQLGSYLMHFLLNLISEDFSKMCPRQFKFH